MTAAKRKRLTLLAGAPGSGKTAWLAHHLRHGVFRHARVVDVGKVHARHCACCSDTASVVLGLRDACREPDDDTERLVLEPAACTDLAPLAEAIRRDPLLSELLVVGEIIVTVDAVRGLQHDPFAYQQVESADCVVVTKVDAASETQLAGLLAEVRRVNPRAALFGAVRGKEAPLPPIADEGNFSHR